jgi:hypothetical protein
MLKLLVRVDIWLKRHGTSLWRMRKWGDAEQLPPNEIAKEAIEDVMFVPLIASTRASGAEGHTLPSADLIDGQVTECAPEVTQYFGGFCRDNGGRTSLIDIVRTTYITSE